MSNAIVRDFSFARDFRSIAWGATLKHNLLRAFFAGIVWFMVTLIKEGKPPWFLLMFPFFYLVILLPLGVVCAKLSPHVPFMGIVAVFFALLIVVGDPLVPMHKPGLFMFSLIIWLLKSEEVDVDVAVSDQRKINRL